jgi:hypothetical protein
LRFSSGWETTEEEWNVLGEALIKVHRAMKTATKNVGS